MLTVLNVVQPNYKSRLKRAVKYFKGNSIKVEHLYSPVSAVKSITYTKNRKKTNWIKLDKFIKAQRNHLLCAEDINLPSQLGYKRFESQELNHRLCTNLALYLLKKQKTPGYNISVGIIDDDASFLELAQYVFDYTDNVFAVTQESAIYSSEADRLLEERGAALHISKNMKTVCNCDLIIAPKRIDEGLNCGENTIILTGEKPAVSQSATVIYKYYFDLPEKIMMIKPDCLDDMYFASALYTMGKVYELGSYVPRLCSNAQDVHTRASLENLINNMVCKNLT